MISSDTPGLDELEGLTLRLKARSGEYCAARTGVTLVLYYGKSMRDMAAPLTKLLDAYFAVIPDGSIRSILSQSGVWREFTKAGLAMRVRKLASEGTDFTSINLSSGDPSHVGEYGLHFFGTDLSNFDVSPREACSCTFEFPLSVLKLEYRHLFESFVAEICDLEPFESGYAGYAFKHLTRSWRDQALAWIAQKAPRFLGLDISYDTFSAAARRRVVNVSWITLLGHPLVKELGGEAQIRSQLSPEIRLRNLESGLAIIAGDVPPIGDVNRGAQDLQLLKEVAALTRPVRISMEIGFGSESFRRNWLSRFD